MNRAIWIVCLSAAACLKGCYSLNQYSGEGSIARGTADLCRYEILLPPLDMTSDREQTFRVSGAPHEHFMITLRVTGETTTLLDGKTFVHATLVDDRGNVFDERKGLLGRAWVQASSSKPGQWLNLIAPSADNTRPLRLSSGSEYTLKVVVRPGTETNSIVCPRLRAGGAVPWE